MSSLVAIAYPQQDGAAAALNVVQKWAYAGWITLEDAVTVTVDANGFAHVHQGLASPAGAAATGALFGGIMAAAIPGSILVGLLAGSAAGIALGGIANRLADYGIPDDFAREIGEQLQPETSALFLLVTDLSPERLEPRLHELGGRVLQTTLPEHAEARLREALAGENE